MAQPAPQPPSLPDQIEGVNLFQYVSNAAALEPDPAIWSQMDIRVLFALGTAAWVKTEIHVRIMKHPDPATMLVSTTLSNGAHFGLRLPQSTLPPAAEIGRVARIARAYYMPVNTIQANATFSDTVWNRQKYRILV